MLSSATVLEFNRAYLFLTALVVDDRRDSLAAPSYFQLPSVFLLDLLENGTHKIASAKNALVRLVFFFRSPPCGQDLRPAALASDQSASGKLRLVPHSQPFRNELVICLSGGFIARSELVQDISRVHPVMTCFAHDGPVAAPRVVV